MAADPKIVSLQAVLNRYPSTSPTLVADGLLGEKTAAALLKALAHIANTNAAAKDTAVGLVSRLVTASGAYDFVQIRASAEGLTTYLNDRADDSRLTVVQTSFTPTIKTTAASDPTLVLAHNQQNKVAAAAAQATQNVPSWVMYASGAALVAAAIGATALSVRKKRRGASRPSIPASVVAGYYQ
jgi:peptidoglycan hydrolase-like protein with peptidoglycan-binding domain